MNIPIMDLLTVVLWSATYVFIIISSWFSRQIKKVSMPYAALMLNFSWEINALYRTQGSWIYLLWTALDLIIFCYGFFCLHTTLKKLFFVLITLLCIALFYGIFQWEKGFVYSAYIIDLIMAFCYIVCRRSLSHFFLRTIAVLKLLGSGVALFVFGRDHIFVVIVSSIAFLVNLVYLFLCVIDKREKRHEILD